MFLFPFFVKILLGLGVALLLRLAIKVLKIVLSAILGKIQSMMDRFKGRIFIGALKTVGKDMVRQMEEEGKTQNIDDIRKWCQSQGYISFAVNDNDDIIDDSIEIVDAEESDTGFQSLMQKNDGAMLITPQ